MRGAILKRDTANPCPFATDFSSLVSTIRGRLFDGEVERKSVMSRVLMHGSSLIMICETQYRMIEHLAPELLEKTCAKWKRMVSKQWQSLLIYENLWV